MRRLLVNTATWILVAAGAFFFSRGGLDYLESKSSQDAIASQWNAQQSARSSLPGDSFDRSAATQRRPAEATVPVAKSRELTDSRVVAAPPPGAAIARLSIPRLEAVLYVVEGDDSRDLKRGPGHLIGTAMPGQDGNCVIAGHRDTHFRVLRNIQKGDEILLTRNGETWRYRVDDMSIVTPDNLAPLRPSRTPVLNLITCYPFNYLGSAPKRFIVHAHLENEPLRASR
jgi:sortase A